MQTATNPKTGERVALVNGAWVPLGTTATNPDTGEKVALAGDKWVPVGKKAQSGGVDFDFGEMVSNIPGSAMKLAGDMTMPIRHPIQTAKGLGNLAQSLAAKVGKYGYGMPMPVGSEDAADAVGRAIMDRYGSVDNAKRTLMTDPVGALADVSGAAMATKLPMVAKLGAAVEPVGAAGRVLHAGAKAVIPDGMAAKLYESAAKFSTTLTPAQRREITQTALDAGVMPTARGVEKVQGRVDILNHQLDDLIANAAATGKPIPVDAVFMHLKELRQTKGGTRLGGQDDLTAIDNIAGKFRRDMAKIGKDTLTARELQKLKVDAYKEIKWDAKRMAGTPIKEDTYKAVARGAKDLIVDRVPEAAGINKELGSLYELMPHLQRTANRLENRNLLSINAPLNIGAGGVVGAAADATGLGAGIGALGAVLGNPKIKAGVAIALNKIKSGDVKWLEANMYRAETRIALMMAGRNAEVSDETNIRQSATQ